MARFQRLADDCTLRVCEFVDGGGALALYQALGKTAAALREAFRAANELRRVARLRHDDDATMFRRWERLPAPLRCVVMEMSEDAFLRVYRGAALRGVEALSRLDASRVDLARRRRTRDPRWFERGFRQAMRDLPDELPVEMLRDHRQQIRDAMGDTQQPDFVFNMAIVNVLVDDEIKATLGASSLAWSWVMRHATCPVPNHDQPLAAYTLVADFCMHLLTGSGVATPSMEPRMGDLDLAAVYEAERVRPLRPRLAAETGTCDGAGGACPHPIAWTCPLCDVAICSACAVGPTSAPTHECDGRVIRFGDRPALVGYMQQFVSKCTQCRVRIATPERLAANARLRARIIAQRDWLATTDRDRLTARARLAKGDAAHAAWLAETYSRNPLA